MRAEHDGYAGFSKNLNAGSTPAARSNPYHEVIMSDADLSMPVKRGRGRPRKNPQTVQVATVTLQPTSVPSVAAPVEQQYEVVAREFATFLKSDAAKSAYLLELNDESTRKRVSTMVVRAMQGYLAAINAQFYAINVQCNDDNNPPTVVEHHHIVVDVIYAITATDQRRITYTIPVTTGNVTYTIS